MEKKLRFGDLVRNSGRPHTFTLWTDPARDPELSRAIKQNRVLSIMQQPSSRRDFGLLGFHREPHTTYLIFPRPLPKEPEARVIGINYQLIEEPETEHPVKLERIAGSHAKKKRSDVSPEGVTRRAEAPLPKPPPERSFTVTVRRTATAETQVTVAATDPDSAKAKALGKVQRQRFPLKDAELQEEIVKAE